MQNRTGNMKATVRISLIAMLCFVIVNIASSASFYTGGGKKKQSSKISANLNFKKNTLSLQNGYRFRGGLTFNTPNKTNLVLNNNAVRFQKGNNLYVVPYKSKPFFSKFKTPQKELK